VSLGIVAAIIVGLGFGTVQRGLLPLAETGFPEALWRVAVSEPVVVLTIDDGLSDRTIEILDLLDRYDAKATFFVHTRSLAESPNGAELLQSLKARGHGIGHHMPEDVPSVSLSAEEFAQGFWESEAAFKALDIHPQYFRAAGGRYHRETMLPLLIEAGYHPQFVMASFLPWDTHLPFPRIYVDQMVQGMFPGAIAVFHDGLQKGEGRLNRTFIGLERFLEAMQQHYRVVSLEMARGDR
jgi:peptidoglycan/xylan/chitin deacetylase (PgdA/CDA1 family)